MTSRNCAQRPGICTHDVPHGKSTTYSNHGCRCEPCSKAWADYIRRRRSERAADVAAGRADVQHGIASTYFNHGCRCSDCKSARAAYNRDLRARQKAKS